MKVADLKLSSAMVNATLPAKTFEIPQAMLTAAAKPAPANATPYQWIIRRQYTGFYYDSDAKYTDDLASLKLVDVAPNVSQTQGGTHNTLFIATNTYLIAVEAPNDDGQAIQSMAMAKKRYPGKPIRYLILTHHHVDHVGGMRTYAAEGATIVMAKEDGDYFRKALARPEALNPDEPKKAFTAKVVEVDGKWSVNDGGREVDAYMVENPHAADMMIVYVPDAKLGIVTDLYVPGEPPPSNANVAALVKGVGKWESSRSASRAAMARLALTLMWSRRRRKLRRAHADRERTAADAISAAFHQSIALMVRTRRDSSPVEEGRDAPRRLSYRASASCRCHALKSSRHEGLGMRTPVARFRLAHRARSLCLRAKDQLLHAPIRGFRGVQLVFRRTGKRMSAGELSDIAPRAANNPENLAFQ